MNETTAPVTAIIPCYRCADTIGRAVESIVAQSLRPAEIILVDDASNDGTPAMLQRLADRHGRDCIQIASLTENSGPGAARNAGWEKASQPFIAFLDADDVWHPEKIALQYRWMLAHPDVEMTGHASALAMPGEPPTVLLSGVPAFRVRPWQMLVSNRFPTRTVMLRRSLPFRFQEDRGCAEDYLLWLQIMLSGRPAWRLETVLAFCHRPDFSPGGYSGDLWKHERRELAALRWIRRDRLVSAAVYVIAAAWSLVKYLRRLVLVRAAPRSGNRATGSGA